MSNELICIVFLGTLCVYQGYRIRQLRLNMLEVDHEKYPDVKQKYRFERVEE